MTPFNPSLFSSVRHDWGTPREVYDGLNAEFHFTMDPCGVDFAKPMLDGNGGIENPWSGVCFMNPPYGRELPRWVEKAYRESQRGVTVVGLIPSRTDTRWWHSYVMRADEIRFLRGRLKFAGARYSAPFPSAVIVWRGRE